jgi:hypothetical protein
MKTSMIVLLYNILSSIILQAVLYIERENQSMISVQI